MNKEIVKYIEELANIFETKYKLIEPIVLNIIDSNIKDIRINRKNFR